VSNSGSPAASGRPEHGATSGGAGSHTTAGAGTTTVSPVPDASPRSAVDVNRVVAAARRRLPFVHFVVDSAFWMVAIPLGVWLRYDYRVAQLDSDLILPTVIAVVLQGRSGSSPVSTGASGATAASTRSGWWRSRRRRWASC
jgi:hypothetical protein